MRRKLVASLLVAASCLVGCSQSKPPDSKNIAVEHWQGARSAVLYSLALDQYKTGNYDKSRQSVNEAMKLSPQNPDLWILSAKLNIEQSQLEAGFKDLNKAVELNPDRHEAHYLLGVINQRWQRLPEALINYQTAGEKSPGELAYVLARAETLVAMDQSRQALALLEERLPFFESNPVIRDAAGQLMMQQKQYGQAVDMFRQATMLATEDFGLKERLAKALFYNNNYREAADMLGRLTRDDRNSTRSDLFAMLGESCLQIDRPSEARAAFETATQISPSSPEGWQGIAKVALNANDLRRAELAIRRAVAIDPGDPQAHLLLGYLRLRENKLKEAMLSFQKATALDQSDAVALCMTGYVMERLGQPQQAIEYYGKALKVNPGDEMASQLMAGVSLDE